MLSLRSWLRRTTLAIARGDDPRASRVGTRCTPFCRRCGGSGNRAFRPHRSRRDGARVRDEPAMRSSPSVLEPHCGSLLISVRIGGMSCRAVIPGRVGVWCCGRWGPRHIRTTEVPPGQIASITHPAHRREPATVCSRPATDRTHRRRPCARSQRLRRPTWGGPMLVPDSPATATVPSRR